MAFSEKPIDAVTTTTTSSTYDGNGAWNQVHADNLVDGNVQFKMKPAGATDWHAGSDMLLDASTIARQIFIPLGWEWQVVYTDGGADGTVSVSVTPVERTLP